MSNELVDRARRIMGMPSMFQPLILSSTTLSTTGGTNGDGDEDQQTTRRKKRRIDETRDFIPLSELCPEEKNYSSCEENDDDEEEGNDGKDCFFCNWGSSEMTESTRKDSYDSETDDDYATVKEQTGNAFNDCLHLMYKNYGIISNQNLARQVHLMFKEKIYKPLIETGQQISMCKTKDIVKHIENHCSIEPRIFLVENLRTLSRISNILQGMIFFRKRGGEEEDDDDDEDGNHRIQCDPKTLKSLSDIIKLQEGLYSANTKKFNFYNEHWSIDLQKIGAVGCRRS